MGLDGVELVLAIEDRFGITLEDGEAAGVVTVGDLERLVQQKLAPQDSNTCLTSFTFYRLRSALMKQFGVTRAQVKPDSSLDGLVPRKRRRVAWAALETALGWRLPELRRPPALQNTLGLLFLLTVLIAVVGGTIGVVSKQSAWLLGLTSVPVIWLAHKLTVPLAVHLPNRWATVGQATESLLARNFGLIAQDRRSWPDEEVWTAIRSTVVEQLGVDPRVVTREARFVEDLGIG